MKTTLVHAPVSLWALIASMLHALTTRESEG